VPVVVLELTRSRVREERAEDVPGDDGGSVVIEGRGEAMVDIVGAILSVVSVCRTMFGEREGC